MQKSLKKDSKITGLNTKSTAKTNYQSLAKKWLIAFSEKHKNNKKFNEWLLK